MQPSPPKKKNQDVSKNMPPSHLQRNSNSNREFIRNTKKSRMFLRTGFVELLIFCYQNIRCNTEVKNQFMVINKLVYNRVFMEGKIPRITLKRPQSSPRVPGNLSRFAIYGGLIRGLSQYRMLLYISIYFLGIFFLFFVKRNVFYFHSFFL